MLLRGSDMGMAEACLGSFPFGEPLPYRVVQAYTLHQMSREEGRSVPYISNLVCILQPHEKIFKILMPKYKFTPQLIITNEASLSILKLFRWFRVQPHLSSITYINSPLYLANQKSMLNGFIDPEASNNSGGSMVLMPVASSTLFTIVDYWGS